LFACKCSVELHAIVQKTIRTVEITHLEAADGRRASLDIALVDADVHLCVDKRLQGRKVMVPEGIENRAPAPCEMVDGERIPVLADYPEESWVAADESPRMEEWSAPDNKISNGNRRRPRPGS
jgi:hypothetical protein